MKYNQGNKAIQSIEENVRGETHLIEGADGREEDNRVGIIKVWDPRMPLAASTTDVVEMPVDIFARYLHVECI